MKKRSKKMTKGLILGLAVAAFAAPIARGQALSERSQVVRPASSSYSTQAYRALMLRSEALNQKYGLGQSGTQNADPWFRSLVANRNYQRSVTTNADPWFLALMARAKYDVNSAVSVRHADDRAGIRGPGVVQTPQLSTSSGSGFDWGDASAAAGTVVFAAVLLSCGIVLSRRKHIGNAAV
jgi:hypothetical protein